MTYTENEGPSKIGDKAGARPKYAEKTDRAKWVMPVSVTTGIKGLLDIYEKEISELRAKYPRLKHLSDIENQENIFPDKDCWTWMQNQIIGSQQYDYIESPVSAATEKTTNADMNIIKRKTNTIF